MLLRTVVQEMRLPELKVHRSCTTVITSNYAFSSPSKRNLMLISNYSHLFPTPSSRQLLIYFLFLSIYKLPLLDILYKWNHIVYSLSVWFLSLRIMFSKLMSVVACIRTSFLFIAKYHSISHFVWSFVSWRTFELFQFLVVVIIPQWIFVYKFMYGRIFLFLLGMCLGVASPGHMISLHITLKI